jgi:hypothetical protein
MHSSLNLLKMSFWSRLKLKNDKDPARSQSGVVESVQNEETSSKTGTKVCCFLSWVSNYLDDCLRRFSQSSREDLGLFRFDNTRQENDYIVELSAAQNTTSDKTLTTLVSSLFMDLVETGKRPGPMITEPYGFEISSRHSYLQRGSCHTATTLGPLSAKPSRT